MTEIAEKLMKPSTTEEEENTQDADATNDEAQVDHTASDVRVSKETEKEKPGSAKSKEKRGGKNTPAEKTTEEAPPEGEEGEAEEEKKEEWLADVVENDFIDNANLLPPKDPEGEDVMVPDLILTKERIVQILERALEVVCDWLIEQK